MKFSTRGMMAAACACLLASSCVMFGCSSQQADQPAENANQNTESAQGTEQTQIQIFAANSLSKALEEVEALYQKSHEGVSFPDTQYKSSGELNEMLAAGSSADVLISASNKKMDDAVSQGYVDEGTRFDMFTNQLVMVAAQNSDIEEVTLDDVASGKYTIAVGDESVPAGNYACQSLSTVGCYSDKSGMGGEFEGALAKDGKVVLDSSVGNVCKHAESGDVDIAFVYTSDVYRFGGVKIVGTVPDDTHKPIVYPAAVCKDSKVSSEANDFLKWAVSDEEALKVWQKWGFELA